MSAQEAVVYARELVARSRAGRTFWRHQGRKPWAIDCVGLIKLACEAGGYAFRTETKPTYGREPWDDQLRRCLQAEFGEPASDAPRVGDVALVRWNRGDPSHVGLLADYWAGGLSIIHAQRIDGVIETILPGSRAGAGVLEVYRPDWGDP
jgi:hypothetical protein